MGLMTYEQEEILHRVRRCEDKIDELIALCAEILMYERPPTYTKPEGIAFAPTPNVRTDY